MMIAGSYYQNMSLLGYLVMMVVMVNAGLFTKPVLDAIGKKPYLHGTQWCPTVTPEHD